MKKHTIHLVMVVFWLLVVGCATNPVTGKKEFSVVSSSQEISMGTKQYVPMKQMQGGEWNLDPSAQRYIEEVGQKLAAVSDRPDLPYEFTILNNGVPNAWALPGGKIAINRGLLTELNSEAELAAVLGHEIVHAAARHGAKSVQRGMLAQLLVMGGSIYAETQSQGAGRTVALAGSLAAQGVLMKYSRSHELEADYYGMKYMHKAGYDTEAAVMLQETFVRLFEGKQRTDFLSGLFASHPPSVERVRKNRDHLQEYPPGGFKGTQAYKQRLTSLFRAKKAYDNLDEGMKAYADKNFNGALALANAAIILEPKEASFYALKSLSLAQLDDLNQAKQSIDDAIERDGSYYQYYYIKGQLLEKSGDKEGAKEAYKQSYSLLPAKEIADRYNAL